MDSTFRQRRIKQIDKLEFRQEGRGAERRGKKRKREKKGGKERKR